MPPTSRRRSSNKQRIFPQLLRKESLGQSRHESDAEGAAADLIGAADEHPAVPMRGRFHFQRCQTIGKHVAHFDQGHRSHGGHGTEIRKHAQHELGAPEHLRRKYFETLNPIAPSGLVGPGGHLFDQWQSETAEVHKVLPLALQARNTWGIGLVRNQLANLEVVLRRQSV